MFVLFLTCRLKCSKYCTLVAQHPGGGGLVHPAAPRMTQRGVVTARLESFSLPLSLLFQEDEFQPQILKHPPQIPTNHQVDFFSH